MGGALRVPGNISPVAEFNFANDAAAASLVLVAFSEKLTILPLDATMLCLLTPTDLDMLHSKSGVVGRWFARDLAPFYMKAYRSYNSVDMPLHDAHTVGAFIRPDLYRGENLFTNLLSQTLHLTCVIFQSTLPPSIHLSF
jgi:purine nucleosidase